MPSAETRPEIHSRLSTKNKDTPAHARNATNPLLHPVLRLCCFRQISSKQIVEALQSSGGYAAFYFVKSYSKNRISHTNNNDHCLLYD
jgi:hypothetical protein